MKKFLLVAALLIASVSTAFASVYVLSIPGLNADVAYSTFKTCTYVGSSDCTPADTYVGIKRNWGDWAGYWLVNPPNVYMPWGAQNDIYWAVDYVTVNNLPRRWGGCQYPTTHWNANTLNCLN